MKINAQAKFQLAIALTAVGVISSAIGISQANTPFIGVGLLSFVALVVVAISML